MKIIVLVLFLLVSCTTNIKQLDNDYDESIDVGLHGTIKTKNNYAKLEKEIELSERLDFLKNENNEFYHKIKSNINLLNQCESYDQTEYKKSISKYEETTENSKEYGYNKSNQLVYRENQDLIVLLQNEEKLNKLLSKSYETLHSNIQKCKTEKYSLLEKKQTKLISNQLKKSGRRPAQIQDQDNPESNQIDQVPNEQQPIDSETPVEAEQVIDQEPQQLEPPQEPYAIENNE